MRKTTSVDKDLIKQLKTLNDNIILLNKLNAINIGKESLFEDKKEMGEKIDALDEFDLPDKYIAAIIGSTPDSVKTTRSQYKKAPKDKMSKSNSK